jgi:hypothetical protein
MKAASKFLLLALALVFAVTLTARAEEEKEKPKKGKEVTLKGMLCCSKCTLKKTDECGNALVVKGKDKKEVIYYLDDKAKGEKYHKGICPPGTKKKATVKGKVSKKDGKWYIKPTSVKVEDD